MGSIMSISRPFRSALAPIAILLFSSMAWDGVLNASPFLVKFGILALLGALASGLMARDSDIRGSVRKGCAGIILGTVLPMFATLYDYNSKICYVLAFSIGLGIDIIYPYLRKWIEQVSRKATKED